MYLDGELPSETFKERMQLLASRYGASLELFGYNRDALGDDEMPPLISRKARSGYGAK